MRQLPCPTANIYSLVINRKIYKRKKAAFSHGSESAAVISAEFIIRFFALGIAVEKCCQMCLLNFKSSLIAKEIIVYPLLLFK